MNMVHEEWKGSNRLSLFMISLVLLLVLLLSGLVLADDMFRRNIVEQGMVDATTSAKIVAQEVELAGERLHEMGTNSARSGNKAVLRTMIPSATAKNQALRAVWLLDTLAEQILDSAWSAGATHRWVTQEEIRELARHVAVSGHLELRGLPNTGGESGTGEALLGEPVLEQGLFTNIAVALVDEGSLLASAGSATVDGRSFLALLVDGDTVAQTPHQTRGGEPSAPVRVPLPGQPAWFVVSTQSPRRNAVRLGIWGVGTGALVLLLFGLIRERQQTIRIGERSVELERLSAELLRANRMKSEFLANVSHELRTPLNAIVGFVDLLRDGGYGELSDRQKLPVERVSTSAARLRTLVDQVLDIAKIAAGRLEVHAETVSLRPFLLNIVGEMEPLISSKGLKVDILTSSSVTKVKTDPTHLRQIVVNLLGNAVKYTEHGEIKLRTRPERIGPAPRSLAITGQHAIPRVDQTEAWLAIDVVDTGIGIAANDLERIFEEFEQVAPMNQPDAEHRGTGLGLAISRRLATLLGGDVSVESTPGQGSTFTIWLPIAEDAGRGLAS